MRHLAWLCCAIALPAVADPAAVIAAYGAGYRQLAIAPLTLSYRDSIDALLRERDLPAQRRVFTRALAEARAASTGAATPCQRLDLQRIVFEAQLHLDKLALLERAHAAGPAASAGTDGLYAMPMGQAWYRYFLKRWLTSDVTPAQLMRFGEDELANVLARYRRIQAAMGYAGRHDAFQAELDSARYRYAPPDTPQADYEARQATIYRNLGKLFPPHRIAPPQVRESTRGAAFPADGYYDSDSHTFYFNKATPFYGRRNLDMLLLHESTPGHHFQSSYAAQAAGCASAAPRVFYSAFAEGWSAYVEQFGRELGLYTTLPDELGAVEWDLVRSIRVVLDVGINHEGWSAQRARAYWQAQLPMLPQLAEREIARVRNWPVQAITYKYGADAIARLRAQEEGRLGERFDLRVFHDQVLRHGSLPLALLPAALATPAPLSASSVP